MRRVDAVLDVWFAARAGVGNEPDEQRVARVREKLTDEAAHLVVVERSGRTVGMALAEPFREDRGRGEIRPRWGHVSMVFVHPDHQGIGVGSELVQRLVAEGPWAQLSVWTRTTNAPARRLYRSHGFVETDDAGTVGGEATRRWERRRAQLTRRPRPSVRAPRPPHAGRDPDR